MCFFKCRHKVLNTLRSNYSSICSHHKITAPPCGVKRSNSKGIKGIFFLNKHTINLNEFGCVMQPHSL